MSGWNAITIACSSYSADTSTLVNHCGAWQVNAAELAQIEPPAPPRTWYPLAHRAVLDSVCSALEGAGFMICRSRLSVSHGGARFFGTLDLTTSVVEGVSIAVGIRNSNDREAPVDRTDAIEHLTLQGRQPDHTLLLCEGD
ncbi:MAG: hypothetical protein C0483_21620 [Pirellula sp.]|nr:hypothetical protein [Pirellula sp.]